MSVGIAGTQPWSFGSSSSGEWSYRLQQTSAPTTYPVTLDEVRAQCDIDVGDEDAALLRRIKMATRWCEGYLDRQFITSTWVLTTDRFPPATRGNPYGSIELPKPPLISVTSLQYLDTSGATQTWAASGNYTVETPTRQRGMIHRAYAITWPILQLHPASLTITFVAGYGAASAVPDTIREAILMLISERVEIPDAGTDSARQPALYGIRELLDMESWGAL